MTYAMVHQPASNNAQSPFRVIVQKTGRQIDWIARYLTRARPRRRHTAQLALICCTRSLVGGHSQN
jgi:hypothetical protein